METVLGSLVGAGLVAFITFHSIPSILDWIQEYRYFRKRDPYIRNLTIRRPLFKQEFLKVGKYLVSLDVPNKD